MDILSNSEFFCHDNSSFALEVLPSYSNFDVYVQIFMIIMCVLKYMYYIILSRKVSCTDFNEFMIIFFYNILLIKRSYRF